MITKEFLNHILDFSSNFMGVVFDPCVASCNLRFLVPRSPHPPSRSAVGAISEKITRCTTGVKRATTPVLLLNNVF